MFIPVWLIVGGGCLAVGIVIGITITNVAVAQTIRW